MSIALLTAKEIRHLQVLKNLRLHLSTSLDYLGARISVSVNHSYRETGTEHCFGHFIPGAVQCTI